MNWYLALFMFGIMIGMFIGVQPLVGSIYQAILGVLKQQKVKKKNKSMFK